MNITATILLVVTIAIIVAVNVGFAFLERYLAKKSRGLGMIMPVFFLIIAIMTMVNSLETSVKQMLTVDSPITVVLVMFGLFVFINIPTIVTYIVFRKVTDSKKSK